MGEYVLKCEPMETQPELKEVLKIIDSPIFTSSIINTEVIDSFSLIIVILLTMFSMYKINENIDVQNFSFTWILVFWMICSAIGIILFSVLIANN
jgi:ABC-type sugar transport system permease subunit